MTIQQNNQPDKPETEGGSEWEVRTAAEMFAEATGNPAAGIAVYRAIEGAINQTISTMAPSFATTYTAALRSALHEGLQDVKAQLAANGNTTAAVAQALAVIDTRMTQSDRADLDWRTQWRMQDDARRDAIHLELDQILSEVGGLRDGQVDLQRGFLDVREHVDGLRLDLADTRRDVAELRANVEASDERKLRELEALRKGEKKTAERIDGVVKAQADAREQLRELRAVVEQMLMRERGA